MTILSINEQICKSLRELQEEKGVTLRQIRAATEIKESTLSNYFNEERAPNAPFVPIVALAKYFDVSLDRLILGKEPEQHGDSPDQVRFVEDVLLQHTIQMEQRVERQNDLFARVINAFRKEVVGRVNAVVKDNEKFNTALISEKDVWRIERCANTVTTATPRMVDEVNYKDGVMGRGLYYDYVLGNFKEYPDVQYQFYINPSPLLPQPNDVEKEFRALLTEDGVKPKKRTKTQKKGTLSIKTVESPIYTQIVLYNLRRGDVKKADPILYERIHDFVSDDHTLAIILAPSVLSQINILMDEEHLSYAREYIRFLESSAKI